MPLLPAGPAGFAALGLQGLLGGGQQIGAAAPAFQPGQAQSPFGDDISAILSQLAQQNNFGNPLQEATQGLAAPGGTPTVPIDPSLGAGGVGPPETPQEQGGLLGGIGNAAGGFFGNLDQNLQSPSKIIGLGLLNRLDPRLGLAGLLGGGLLGKNKVF